jgi:hypothetical protein
MGEQHPAGVALLDRVQAVRSHLLSDLGEEGVGVAMDQLLQAFKVMSSGLDGGSSSETRTGGPAREGASR